MKSLNWDGKDVWMENYEIFVLLMINAFFLELYR